MSTTFKLDTRELEKAFKKLEKEVGDKGTKEILQGAGFVFAGHVKQGMHNTPKTGREYTVTKTGPRHTASSPGGYPAVDTGNLVNSIRAEMEGDKKVRIGTNVLYALFLEFGTRFMGARPFMRKTWDERIGDIVTYIREQIKKRIT